ncbi:hypothetical protein HDU83_003992 [Entophlyctis luteolus]|nr:hypothetical protein HDU82_005258 [Entophlyctis luteolus]KAJ3355095.1 hypothetical protein HDU83_003992 [Entophlyctis luteolus]KAJ3393260.1 hypothetical protein HDU84_002339 [Entophlyctis sp. JEL0112]
MTQVDAASLAYLRSAVDIAVLPGAESHVPARSHAADSISLPRIAVAASSAFTSGGASASPQDALATAEQGFVALLETGRISAARAALDAIARRPGVKADSLRVAKLRGMLLEAEGSFAEAEKVYSDALAKDETYAPIMKRKIALLLTQERTQEAITALVIYLDHFHSDLEGWTTLASLYMQGQMYQQAAFALEECMVLSAFNFLYHIRYAELMMTMNRPAIALKYFCSATEVTESSGGTLRAWYGIRQATRALMDEAAAGGDRKKGAEVSELSLDDWTALNTLAGERIAAAYARSGVSAVNREVVQEWLKRV